MREIKLALFVLNCFIMILPGRFRSVVLAFSSGDRLRLNPRISKPSIEKFPRYFSTSIILKSSDKTAQDASSATKSDFQYRRDALHDALRRIHLDPEVLSKANLKNMQDPTLGYDSEIGKPAIRTYRSFLYPKKADEFSAGDDDAYAQSRLLSAADRCARQIDFLRRRHLSHETDWVRHTDTEDFVSDSERKDLSEPSRKGAFPLILVLDNVRSAFNVGSIFRTADACGCQQVITTGITAHPTGSGAEKLRKSALGADRLVSSEHFSSTKTAFYALKERFPDYSFIGMETTEQSRLYTEVEYPRSGCIVILGNEVTGIDPELMTELDSIVEIPMFGAKNSLNIAACAPVVLYEILRQWNVSNSKSTD